MLAKTKKSAKLKDRSWKGQDCESRSNAVIIGLGQEKEKQGSNWNCAYRRGDIGGGGARKNKGGICHERVTLVNVT